MFASETGILAGTVCACDRIRQVTFMRRPQRADVQAAPEDKKEDGKEAEGDEREGQAREGDLPTCSC